MILVRDLTRVHRVVLTGLVSSCLQASAYNTNFLTELGWWSFTTEAYKRAALQVLLEEANVVVTQLHLPETLPITKGDLVEINIRSPFWSERAGSFGSISTTNYHYYASQGNKLSSVVRNLGVDDVRLPIYVDSLKQRYATYANKINTNAAYEVATQWLAAAMIDIEGLERDSRISIRTWPLGNTFIPVYAVSWAQPYEAVKKSGVPQDTGYEPVASIEFLEPERRLLQMHINKEKYIKRKPLTVPNRDQLLRNTNDPKMQKAWFTTKAYDEAALDAMLKEVNRVREDLKFRERLPLQVTDLTRIAIETPYIAEKMGRFATLYTEEFVYGAHVGNKLSYINRSIDFKGDRPRYLSMLKSRYATPKTQVNTNAAYMLATQWLHAASVDVKALELDCTVRIYPWSLDGDRFVPLYTLEWAIEDPAKRERRIVATVELLEPERSLEKLWVEKPQYLKREPLSVPNRERLLEIRNSK